MVRSSDLLTPDLSELMRQTGFFLCRQGLFSWRKWEYPLRNILAPVLRKWWHALSSHRRKDVRRGLLLSINNQSFLTAESSHRAHPRCKSRKQSEYIRQGQSHHWWQRQDSCSPKQCTLLLQRSLVNHHLGKKKHPVLLWWAPFQKTPWWPCYLLNNWGRSRAFRQYPQWAERTNECNESHLYLKPTLSFP